MSLNTAQCNANVHTLFQQGIQSTTCIQCIQVITAANVLCVNKNLGNRGATAAFDHLFTLGGIADDGSITVTGGVSTGDRVVKAGVEYLQDNEKVTILPAPAETNVGDIL